MMAPTLSTTTAMVMDTLETQRPISFSIPLRLHNPSPKRFAIFSSQSQSEKTQSLSDSSHPQILAKPKSIWVRPGLAVVDLHPQKRSLFSYSYSYDPLIKELKIIAAKINDCGPSEHDFQALLDQLPKPISRGNALLVLNNLRPWPKACLFFDWIKTQNSVPMETIFYNVVMKSLRFGRQFDQIEKLAQEMVSSGIVLDNITYSTIITCANKCGLFDKAVEWFERMYKTGLMPDEVTYSAILDVYAQSGRVEQVLSLYKRGRSIGWNPDTVAFRVLGKMFGEAGDYDGIRYVLQEMKVVGVKPTVAVYNTLLEAMGKAGKPGLAKSLFEEMLESGITPKVKTLTLLVKIYGRVRWARDAMELWGRMKENKWPMDFILYNTLLSMCADVGLVEEAEKLFQDMKESKGCSPDAYSYTAMLNLYGSEGNDGKAMELFEKMCEMGSEINVMGCTCLIQCLGKAGRIDDLVRVFDISVKKGVRPDDRLCGCLLSVVALCEKMEDVDNIISCLQQSNPKLVAFVKLMEDEKISLDVLKEEFKCIISDVAVDARRPICNCFIDICRKRNVHDRAHDMLYLGTMFGLYPDLHKKTADEWCLDVRSLSVGAAHTALEEWMGAVSNIVRREEVLPKLLVANAGLGTHRFSQGLASSFASHVQELAVPLRQSEDKAGCFVATKEDIESWVQARNPSAVAA